MKLRSPALTLDMEVAWPEIRNNYARQIAKKHGKNVGAYLVGEVNRVFIELGQHFRHPNPKVKVSTAPGDKRAFAKFVQSMRTQWPEVSATMKTPKM